MVAIQDQHLLVRLCNVLFGLQLQMLALDAAKKSVDVLERLIFVNLVVSNSRDDSIHIFQV